MPVQIKRWYTLREASQKTDLTIGRLRLLAKKNPQYVRSPDQQYWKIKLRHDFIEILKKINL